MKICPVGAELPLADGRTETLTDSRDEANSCFSQFIERAWKWQIKALHITPFARSLVVRAEGTFFNFSDEWGHLMLSS